MADHTVPMPRDHRAAPIFEPVRRGPMSFHSYPRHRNARHHEDARLTCEVAEGVGLILNMLERDDVETACGDDFGRQLAPILSPTDRGHLQTLAIRTLELLRDHMEDVSTELDREARRDEQSEEQPPHAD